MYIKLKSNALYFKDAYYTGIVYDYLINSERFGGQRRPRTIFIT